VAKPKPFSETMQARFQELEEICRERGGAIISQPFTNPLKLVVRIGSVLPQILANIGHSDIRNIGIEERLMPWAMGVAPTTVAVYEFTLPSDVPSDNRDIP
jgi:hypothetical protein